MNNDVKYIIEQLREPVWGEPVRVVNDRLRTAALFLEFLAAELEQVKHERDAAMEDVSGYCATCAFVDDCAKHDLNDSAPYCRWFYGDCEDWQWRGVKEDPDD